MGRLYTASYSDHRQQEFISACNALSTICPAISGVIIGMEGAAMIAVVSEWYGFSYMASTPYDSQAAVQTKSTRVARHPLCIRVPADSEETAATASARALLHRKLAEGLAWRSPAVILKQREVSKYGQACNVTQQRPLNMAAGSGIYESCCACEPAQ